MPEDLVNIGSDNGLVPSGTKPLPEPVLTKISDDTYGITRPQWVKPSFFSQEMEQVVEIFP